MIKLPEFRGVSAEELRILRTRELPWWKDVEALATFHLLCSLNKDDRYKKGIRKSWRLKDTAKAVKRSIGSVCMDIQLGITFYPEQLEGMKNKAQAYRELRLKCRGVEV